MAKFGIYLSKNVICQWIIHTILKYFLCILSFLTSCKLGNLGVHMVCSCIFGSPSSYASWACLWSFTIYPLTPQEFKPWWMLAFAMRSWWICGFIQKFAAYTWVESIPHVLLQTSGPEKKFFFKKTLLLCIIKYFISLNCIDF